MNRLGFLVDFLSHAAIVGFMGGAAIIIGLQQLKGLFGINHFTNKTDIISVMKSVWESVDHPVSVTLIHLVACQHVVLLYWLAFTAFCWMEPVKITNLVRGSRMTVAGCR